MLQLIHTGDTEPDETLSTRRVHVSYTERGQFIHGIDKEFTADFNEIQKEIEQETFRVAGQNEGVPSSQYWGLEDSDSVLYNLSNMSPQKCWTF